MHRCAKFIQSLVRKPKGNEILVRPRQRWKGLKLDIQKIG